MMTTMTRECTQCETIYGFSCTSTSTSTSATETLLSVSDTQLQAMTREKSTLETFLGILDKTKPEPGDKGVQRKVKASSSGGSYGEEGCQYVFTHFEDLEKYIQRYRYYHTVYDTGQTQMDPQALGIEVPGHQLDNHSSRSSRSVYSPVPSTVDCRNLAYIQRTRRSVSDLSTSAIRRNKSAPCSQNLRSSKRVFLTWDQYVEMCGADITPRHSHFSPQTESTLVSDETEQMTVKCREVTSAYSPRRTPCLDFKPVSSRTQDNANQREACTDADDNQITTTRSLRPSTIPSVMPSAKSDLCLSERKLSPKVLAKLENVEKPKPFKMAGRKSLTNRSSSDRVYTEGSPQTGKDKPRKKMTSLPESHLEHAMSSVKLSDKRSADHEQLKKIVNSRCRNSRVSAVYKFTKVRRKQIHL